MRTHDTHPHMAPLQREAAATRHIETGSVATGIGDASVQPSTLQAYIDRSPRMLAQRQALRAVFGDAFQCKIEAPRNQTGMPNTLKAGIEALAGMDLSDVRVHRNSSEPARLNASAYAQGNDIHLGPGQERHLPHEAWHVVQQRQGRVQETMRLPAGVSVNDDAVLEQEADLMGRKAAAASSIGVPEAHAQAASVQPLSTIQRVVRTGTYKDGAEFEYQEGQAQTTGEQPATAPSSTGQRGVAQFGNRKKRRQQNSKLTTNTTNPTNTAYTTNTSQVHSPPTPLGGLLLGSSIELLPRIYSYLDTTAVRRLNQVSKVVRTNLLLHFPKEVLSHFPRALMTLIKERELIPEFLEKLEPDWIEEVAADLDAISIHQWSEKMNEDSLEDYARLYENLYYQEKKSARNASTGASGKGKWKNKKLQNEIQNRLKAARQTDKGQRLWPIKGTKIQHQADHKIPQTRLRALGEKFPSELYPVLASALGNDRIESPGAATNALLRFRPNLEIGIKQRGNELGSEFDGNYYESGQLTPRSEILEEVDQTLHSQHEIDFAELIRKLKQVKEVHEDRYGTEISPPDEDRWQPVKGAKWDRGPVKSEK